jgi:excisionase family DNA binding protein
MKNCKNDQIKEYNFNTTPEYSHGCYTTESLAERLNVSKKFIVSHRRRLPGAMKVGRIWRFDRVAVEKKLLSGNLF